MVDRIQYKQLTQSTTVGMYSTYCRVGIDEGDFLAPPPPLPPFLLISEKGTIVDAVDFGERARGHLTIRWGFQQMACFQRESLKRKEREGESRSLSQKCWLFSKFPWEDFLRRK